MARPTKRHFSVTLEDNSGSKSLSPTDTGDFSFDGIQEGLRGAEPLMLRSVIDCAVEGDEVPMSGTFSVPLASESFSDGSADRLLDAINQTGSWSSATTTNPGGVAPWLCKLKFSFTHNGTTSYIQWTRVRLSAALDESSLVPTYNISWTNLGGPSTVIIDGTALSSL